MGGVVLDTITDPFTGDDYDEVVACFDCHPESWPDWYRDLCRRD